MKRQIERWTTRLHIRMWRETWEAQRRIDLDVRGRDQISIVRAHFTGFPDHPRALLTMLEGLALWQGAPLGVAISADAPVCDSLGLGAVTVQVVLRQRAVQGFGSGSDARIGWRGIFEDRW